MKKSRHIQYYWCLEPRCVLFRLLTQRLPFPRGKDMGYLGNQKAFLTDILVAHDVSEDGISLLSEMMKSNHSDRMTLTIALLHSWISIPSTPKDRNFREKNTADASLVNQKFWIQELSVVPLFPWALIRVISKMTGHPSTQLLRLMPATAI